MRIMRILYTVIALIIILVFISTIMARRESVQRPYDWLYMSLTEPETLNPVTASDASAGAVNALIIEPLIKRNPFTFEWEPCLAERWETSDDKLEFTFHLRKGVKWHDGSEFTADDVAYSYERSVKDLDVRYFGRSGWVDNESFEIIDKYTVKFRWKKKYFLAFNACGEMGIVPRKAFENATGEEFNQHEMGRGCVGTGPYKVVKWDTGKNIILERNEDYWGEKPFFKRVQFVIVSEPFAALELFKKGVIDVCGPSDVAWAKLTGSESFKKRFIKYSYPSFTYSYVVWNAEKIWFKDKRVRRAMTHLIDRRKFIEKIRFGLGNIITGPCYPASPAYNRDVVPYEYDPEMAKKLLDEAGWIDRDGDGVRENEDGIKFDFEFLVISISPTSQKRATLLQEECRKVGIVMRQRTLEWSIFLKYLHEHNFDATSLAWILGIDIDHYQLWHSSGAGVQNTSNYAAFRNEEADKIIEATREEFDDQKRHAMLREFHRIIHEEQPYTFVMIRQNKVLINKRLVNVNYSPAGTRIYEWSAVPWDKIDYSQPSFRKEK